MADLRRYRMLIDGGWVDASDGATFDSLNPATGLAWARVPEATADDVERAVSPIAAFGGVKGSGFGRASGMQAMHNYTRPKTVWMNTPSTPLGSQFVAR